MHLHASNWQHKFYFQHYTTPRDVPRQHSINSYLIPPLVLHLPSYLPPPSLLLQFYTERRHIVMFSRTYCWCTEISTCAHDCCLCGKEKGKKTRKENAASAAPVHFHGVYASLAANMFTRRAAALLRKRP